MLGHAPAAMTSDVHADLCKDDLDADRSLLGGAGGLVASRAR